MSKEYINKATFNKLTIKQQVQVFNSLLNKHKNIKEVCFCIGISYSTIRDRFHKNKYSYNKSTNEYQLSTVKSKHNYELEKIIKEVVNNLDRKKIEPINLDDDVAIRSFRVYKNVLCDFIDFCDNSSLKQYHVLSLFLMEGMEKYKKAAE